MKQHNSGYILVITVFIISMAALLVTSIANRSITFAYTTRLAIERKQAQLIATSGINIAMCQLLTTGSQQAASLTMDIEKLLPILNTWKTTTFTESIEGMDGTCHYYISSEDGKIPINALIDWKTCTWQKDQTSDSRALIELIAPKLNKPLGISSLVGAIESLCKNNKEPLIDITQLFVDSKKPTIDLIPEPLLDSKDKQKLALFDIFTIFSARPQVQPLALSASLITLIGLKQPARTTDAIAFVKKLGEIQNWTSSKDKSAAWDNKLAPWYGASWSSLPVALQNVLAAPTKFEPTTFSVVSYGTVGNVSQRIYAIIVKDVDPQTKHHRFIVKRWYWL